MVDSGAARTGLFGADEEADEDELQQPAPRRGSLKRVTLIVAGVAAVAVVTSGVIYGPTFARVIGQSSTEIKRPAKVGAFELDQSSGATDTAEYVRDAVATKVNLDDSVGLIYQDKAAVKESVILAAGTGRIWKPGGSLKDAFTVVSDDSGGVQNIHDVAAGTQGGVVQCGTTTTDGADLQVCGWADNGSVAVALFPGRTEADAARLIVEFRKAIEQQH